MEELPKNKHNVAVVAFIEQVLNELYPNPIPPLKHTSPFTLLISVLLSANSTDKVVNRVTGPLFARANTPQKMSRLRQSTIEKLIRPAGLAPKKALAIRSLAKLLLLHHKGEVPRSFEALEALPGVGHKTASVVLSQAFNIPAFAVDTHIHRLAKRWGLSHGKNVVETERDLKVVFPKREWAKRHLQLIYFAREYCPARFHKEAQCPICSVLIEKNLTP